MDVGNHKLCNMLFISFFILLFLFLIPPVLSFRVAVVPDRIGIEAFSGENISFQIKLFNAGNMAVYYAVTSAEMAYIKKNGSIMPGSSMVLNMTIITKDSLSGHINVNFFGNRSDMVQALEIPLSVRIREDMAKGNGSSNPAPAIAALAIVIMISLLCWLMLQ